MTIYIVSHLRLSRPHDPGQRVIYVGPLSGKDVLDDYALSDAHSSPNIAEKNKTHCELTALHQIALIHQHGGAEAVGLVHYRRRFISGPVWLKKIIRSTQKSEWTRSFSNFLLRKFELSNSKAEELLKSHDVILPTAVRLKKSVKDSYISSHVPEDWEKLEKIISGKFPEDVPGFIAVQNRKSLHLYNMFVGSADFLNDYSEWLFKVIDQLENEIHPLNRDTFQMRVFGFLSERLLNVYLMNHPELRVLELPVVQLYNESVVHP